jgi:hypothetical protein
LVRRHADTRRRKIPFHCHLRVMPLPQGRS